MYNLELLNLDELTPTGSPIEFAALCPNPNHQDTHIGSFFVNMQTGFYKCFRCGFKGHVTQLVKITGGKVQQVSNLQIRDIKKQLDLKWRGLITAPLAFNNQYLKTRKCDNDIVKTFDIRETNNGIAFPLKNPLGEIIGFQERTYSGFPSRYHIWGERPRFYTSLDTNAFLECQKVFIVEGIFGVINAYKCGYTAISFLGASSHDKLTLSLLQNPEIVVLYDNDAAGIENTREIVRLSDGRIGGLIPGCETDEITKYSWDEYNEQIPIYNFKEIRIKCI